MDFLYEIVQLDFTIGQKFQEPKNQEILWLYLLIDKQLVFNRRGVLFEY